MGLAEGWSSAKKALTRALLLSRACLEEFLNLPGLSGRQICSDSHMPYERPPLGGRELTRAAGHMAAATVNRP